jgi:DNA-binding NarL/FixJ family response regulator
VVVLDVGREPDPEVVWRLTAERAQLPVLAVGQTASETFVRQALQAGARGYLLWDTGAEELIQAIRAVLQGLMVLHPSAGEALLGDELAASSPAPSAEPLTPREREVLHLLVQGLPSKTIASRLRLSEHTVKFHIGSIMTKLGAASRTEAVTLALRRGLITL